MPCTVDAMVYTTYHDGDGSFLGFEEEFKPLLQDHGIWQLCCFCFGVSWDLVFHVSHEELLLHCQIFPEFESAIEELLIDGVRHRIFR